MGFSTCAHCVYAQRREEALQAMQDSMRKQAEQELALDMEAEGYRKDIVKEQVGHGP